MSYDFEVWSQNKLDTTNLSLDDCWTVSKDGMLHESKSWLISCDFNIKCEQDDIPDEIMSLIPAISYLTYISVQPISAPKTAITKAKKIAKLIGEQTVGVVLDKQTDKYIFPQGYKKYKPVKLAEDKRISILNMIWYMKALPFADKNELGEFLYFLQRSLPEALPKRYGTFEPPEFKLDEHCIEHFRDFLYDIIFNKDNKDNTDIVVWYPNIPVLGVSLNYGKLNKRLGFLFPYFEIEIDSRVLDDQGWILHLQRLWRAISLRLNPFYGEIRLLKNAISSRTTYWTDSMTENSPTRSGFWRGIPQNLGIAIVTGKEYSSVWPRFNEQSEKIGNLNFLECADWSNDSTLLDVIDLPPAHISQHHIPRKRELKTSGIMMHWNTKFPNYWPFEDIFDIKSLEPDPFAEEFVSDKK